MELKSFSTDNRHRDIPEGKSKNIHVVAVQAEKNHLLQA